MKHQTEAGFEYQTGRYSEFDLDEYRNRYEKLIECGKKQGFDAFLFTDEENLRYFAGGPLTDAFCFRSDYIAVIIPTDTVKAPRFVLSESRINATHSSWIKDKFFWGGSMESAGDVTLNALVDSLRDLGLADATVAMEVSGNEKLYMPMSVFDGLRQILPALRIVSCHDVVSAIRGIKSPGEINYIRKACRVTAEAIEWGFSTIQSGTTEKDISRSIKARMYELGADNVPFLTVIAGWEGRSICWDSYATDYAVKSGDAIQVDGGCEVNGYVADMVRTASLGKVSNDRYLELYAAATRAHYAVRELLRPGAIIHDICEAGRRSIIDDGYEKLLVFGAGQTGHGLGLGIHEEPFLVSGNHKTLELGMILSIEPVILECPDLECSTFFTIIENNYLITETGFEQLTTSPEEIRVV